jgi:hypothetical protein
LSLTRSWPWTMERVVLCDFAFKPSTSQVFLGIHPFSTGMSFLSEAYQGLKWVILIRGSFQGVTPLLSGNLCLAKALRGPLCSLFSRPCRIGRHVQSVQSVWLGLW